MPTILDETAILRYVLKDHTRQAQQVADVIATGDAYVYPETVTRAAVVLRDLYHAPRSMIARVLDWMLDEVNAAEKNEIRLALRYFGSSATDFTDCMALARNTLLGYSVLSFDKSLMKRALP